VGGAWRRTVTGVGPRNPHGQSARIFFVLIGLLVATACQASGTDQRLVANFDDTTAPRSSTPITASGPPVSGTMTTPTASATMTSTTPPTDRPSGTVSETDPRPAIQPSTSRIAWAGETRYIHGANLPWVNFGCDFGCGADGGVSSLEVQQVVEDAFQSARAMGMQTIRWWVFPGSPVQLTVDGDGLATGIDPMVFTDLDAAVELADRYDLDLILTLFSSPLDLPDSWVTSEVGRARLSDVLAGLFARYAGTSTIMTWQVFNEPEWNFWERLVDVDSARELVRMVTDVVHEVSGALVSIGTARLDGLKYWTDIDLDYYTVHWYDPMTAPDQCAICTTWAEVAGALKVDKPVLIGEFYLGSEVQPDERLHEFHERGYAGALAWSLLPDRTGDGLMIDADSATRFGESLAELDR
jgi:hypothetical protein